MGYRRRYKRRRKVRPPKHGSSGVNNSGGVVMNTSRMTTRGQGGGHAHGVNLPEHDHYIPSHGHVSGPPLGTVDNHIHITQFSQEGTYSTDTDAGLNIVGTFIGTAGGYSGNTAVGGGGIPKSVSGGGQQYSSELPNTNCGNVNNRRK